MADSTPNNYIGRTRILGRRTNMALPALSILERRRDQMFPELDPSEIERMRRFGEARNFAQGEAIFTAAQNGPGLVVILSGKVDIVRHEFSRESVVVTHGPGQFLGELAQLAGRPALADAVSLHEHHLGTATNQGLWGALGWFTGALIIAPERLRALDIH